MVVKIVIMRNSFKYLLFFSMTKYKINEQMHVPNIIGVFASLNPYLGVIKLQTSNDSMKVTLMNY